MKKIKKLFVLFILLGGASVLSNCQDSNFEDFALTEKVLKNKPTKQITFKGLKVKHRFMTPEGELGNKHTKKSLKALFKKLKEKNKKHKNLYVKLQSQEDELPNADVIVEASKLFLEQFPYKEIVGYVALNRPSSHLISQQMIEDDFSDLSDQEIKDNADVIDEYYSQNLDYLVLDEIAAHPERYEYLIPKNTQLAKTSFLGDYLATYICTIAEAVNSGYGFIRGTISYVLASSIASTSSTTNYPSMGEGDTRRDAYRHTLWNALLADYYFTISSKIPRLGFAKLVTDARENSCAASGDADAKAMDLHNNAIGRKIWDDNTSYVTVFGFTLYINTPSTSSLKILIRQRVEEQSCFVVKDDNPNHSFDYTKTEAQTLIEQTGVNTIVYFKGPIAPRRYETITTYVDSDCFPAPPVPYVTNNQNQVTSLLVEREKSNGTLSYQLNFIGQDFKRQIRQPDPVCVIEITTTVSIDACFVSKDLNYNPYE